MKKKVARKNSKTKAVSKNVSGKNAAQAQGPDIRELIDKILNTVITIEKKMDALAAVSVDNRPQPIPEQPKQAQINHEQPKHELKPVQPNNNNMNNQHHQHGKNYFKAVCADCHKDCEVPFRPTGDRPVYCRECFAKRKENRTFRQKQDHRQKPFVKPQMQTKEPEMPRFDKSPFGNEDNVGPLKPSAKVKKSQGKKRGKK